ncbi:hypothetical protein H0H93_015333 [Arthromyces matolae]|nr:hypothetical protein H0H93_015333 [Arthromyces matolae]
METEQFFPILHELAGLLCSPLSSVEILPGGLEDWKDVQNSSGNGQQPTSDFPFLLLDGNLGIPKKILYKLYLSAIALFTSSKSVPELCRVATCTILLANPAHQTALNARKRLVLIGMLDPGTELLYVETLFHGSSTCAKESILWHHRRWLLSLVYEGRLRLGADASSRKWTTSSDLYPLPHIPPEVIDREFQIIRSACASYPRNYHAWAHWHFMTDIVYTALLTHEGPRDSAYFLVLTQELHALRCWLDKHVSDHSCVFRLVSLDKLFGELETKNLPMRDATSRSLMEHAHSLVTSYPSHESLWIYLRDAAATISVSDKQLLMKEIQASSKLFSSPFSHYFTRRD